MDLHLCHRPTEVKPNGVPIDEYFLVRGTVYQVAVLDKETAGVAETTLHRRRVDLGHQVVEIVGVYIGIQNGLTDVVEELYD